MKLAAPLPFPEARARRAQLEASWADRARRLCDPTVTGMPIGDLAERVLGMSRSDLYEVFAGTRHLRASSLELLPSEVEHLRSRALAHGYELASVAGEHASLGEVVGQVGALLAKLAASEADGHLSPSEATTDIAAIERLEEVLARAKATRRLAIERRGMRVAGGRDR